MLKSPMEIIDCDNRGQTFMISGVMNFNVILELKRVFEKEKMMFPYLHFEALCRESKNN